MATGNASSSPSNRLTDHERLPESSVKDGDGGQIYIKEIPSIGEKWYPLIQLKTWDLYRYSNDFECNLE